VGKERKGRGVEEERRSIENGESRRKKAKEGDRGEQEEGKCY